MTVPVTGVVVGAHLYLRQSGTSADSLYLELFTENDDQPQAFGGANPTITQRLIGKSPDGSSYCASESDAEIHYCGPWVDWEVTGPGDGRWHKSPNLARIVQEQIAAEGWDSGDDIVILVRPNPAKTSGTREFYAYDFGQFAPVLEIEWVKKDEEPFSRVRLDGQGDWNVDLYRQEYNLQAGDAEEGIKVEFKVSQDDADARLTLEASNAITWGVVAGTRGSGQSGIRVEVYDGSSYTYPKELISSLETDTWYVLTLKVGNGGWLYAEVYQKDDPSQRGTYAQQLAGNHDWRFHSWVYRETLWLDDYFELEHHTTQYAYDVMDNLKFVTDTVGNETTMIYDALGRKTSMTDPDMGTWTYTYDVVGNLTGQTDARETTIAFEYDALNRLTRKDYPTGDDVFYGYDNAKGDASTANSVGRLRVMYTGSEDQNGHLYEYDDRGQVVTEVVKLSSTPYTTTYGYDPLGRVVTMTYPDGEVVTSTYNAMGLPVSLNGITDTYVSDMSYNAAGQVKAINYNDGALSTQYGYYGYQAFVMGDWDDAPPSWGARDFGRLWRIHSYATSPHTVLQDLQYAYDPVGNVTGINDVKNGEEVSFTYDTLDRLIGASGAYTTTYTYNAIGNVLTKTEDVTYTYSYPAAGQPRPHAPTEVNGNSYSYDENGNLTSDGQRTLAWDHENRLTSVTYSGNTTSYTYDGHGNRVMRVIVLHRIDGGEVE